MKPFLFRFPWSRKESKISVHLDTQVGQVLPMTYQRMEPSWALRVRVARRPSYLRDVTAYRDIKAYRKKNPHLLFRGRAVAMNLRDHSFILDRLHRSWRKCGAATKTVRVPTAYWKDKIFRFSSFRDWLSEQLSISMGSSIRYETSTIFCWELLKHDSKCSSRKIPWYWQKKLALLISRKSPFPFAFSGRSIKISKQQATYLILFSTSQ